MANIGVLQFAQFFGVSTAGGMAQKVGLDWPPPPAVSIRNVIRLAGDRVAARTDEIAAPWAVLLCKFSDDLSEPYPRSFYEALFTSSGAGNSNLVDFFRDASERKLDVSGSKVLGWYKLDQKRSDYTGLDTRNALIDWAKQKASADGVDLGAYAEIVVCMNVPTDLFGVVGGGAAVCDNGIWQGGQSSLSPGIVGQEMAHGYGLDHSRADGSQDDYKDPWDVMSTLNADMAPHPTMTQKDLSGRPLFWIGPMLNAANMDSRGWLDESRVWSAPGPVVATVTLRPLASPNVPGWLAGRIGKYLVEFRVKEGWDANIPNPAVLIHRFEDNHSYIMSSTDGKQGLVPGSIFQDGDPNLPEPWAKVEVLSIDAYAYTATVRLSSN
jgi:hypothetical protein